MTSASKVMDKEQRNLLTRRLRAAIKEQPEIRTLSWWPPLASTLTSPR
jgi:hypothetical protein